MKLVPPAEGLSLSRWSRLKRRGGETAVAPPPEGLAAPEVVNAAAMPPSAAEAAHMAELKLPQLSSISLVEDFTPFMQARVPNALRQQALKALFKEPHFNVMDGLDTYIDDYTVFEPITPEVMATLSSWKTIMKPTQQVVTPGGYAVDVESEEGQAVLAARAEADALAQGLSAGDHAINPNALPDGETESATLPSEAVTNDAADLSLGRSGDDGLGAEAKPTLDYSSTMASIQHPRYNKRVSDFTYVDAPEVPPPGVEKAE